MNETYIISGDTLAGIADAIRAKKDTTAIFTPEQMAVEISKIVDAESMPNAEDAYFGTLENAYEYGMTAFTPGANYSGNSKRTHGNIFTINKSCACVGIRTYYGSAVSGEYPCGIYTDAGELLAKATQKVAAGWVETFFDTPVNLEAGKSYLVCAILAKRWHGVEDGTTFSSKVTYVDSCYVTSDTELTLTCPNPSLTSSLLGIDIIMDEILTESVITEYKIQKGTVASIVDEVNRITGMSGQRTIAEVITALQGLNIALQAKTVTPAETAQTITPDSGYYGLSSVTVGAIPATESETTA